MSTGNGSWASPRATESVPFPVPRFVRRDIVPTATRSQQSYGNTKAAFHPIDETALYVLVLHLLWATFAVAVNFRIRQLNATRLRRSPGQLLRARFAGGLVHATEQAHERTLAQYAKGDPDYAVRVNAAMTRLMQPARPRLE